MTTTDAELLMDARDAPAAFEQLVARHLDTIYRYVARRVGPTNAEDVVSEVFATAYAIRGRYDTSRPSALPWLYGIATNLIRRHHRREAALLQAYALSGVYPELPDAPHHDDDLGPALAGALAAMRREHRDVLLLHALADLTYEEIAVALDVPIGTVRGWLNRARAVATRELAARGILPASTSPEPEAKVTES
jgi:RNA polymerase sigma factor (sigma-70 family)